MEGDPTGGMWIYLIFFMIPLVRIIPYILRKYRRKNAGLEPEPAEKDHTGQFLTNDQFDALLEFLYEISANN